MKTKILMSVLSFLIVCNPLLLVGQVYVDSSFGSPNGYVTSLITDSATTASDITHSATFAANDNVAVRVTRAGASVTTDVVATFEVY